MVKLSDGQLSDDLRYEGTKVNTGTLVARPSWSVLDLGPEIGLAVNSKGV